MAIHTGTTQFDDQQLNIIDYAAGSGMLGVGVKLALEALGLSGRVVCYVEREVYAAAALVARMEDQTLDKAPVWSDAKTFDGTSWCGIVDILTAGYPCQPFSAAGKRLGEKDDRHLWPEVCRAIAEIQPGLVYLENVEGHLSLGLGTVLHDLEERGYRTSAGLFAAAEVGASHQRKRVFILAYSDNIRSKWSSFTTENHCQMGEDGKPAQNTPGMGIDVADTPGIGSKQLPISIKDPEKAEKNKMDSSQRECGGMANATGGRLPGSIHSQSPEKITEVDTQKSSAAIFCQQLFAPGPHDSRQWEQILKQDKTLEPALCGMADGMASRMDRLHTIGNGVVPLQAAYAFITLGACLWSGENM